MKDDIKYIDDITKKNFEGFMQTTKTSWADFYEKHAVQLHPKTSFSLRKLSFAVISASVASAGILLYLNNQDTTVMQKKIIVKEKSLNKKDYKRNTIDLYNKELKENTKDIFNKKEKPKIKNKNNKKYVKKEDVIVKIEIPIHKKIEVRKQIIIDDSIN